MTVQRISNVVSILFCVMVLAMPTPASAQRDGGFRGRGGSPFGGGGTLGLIMRDDVQEELQLVNDQREKVEAAVDDARQQMRDEMRDMFSQMRDLSDEQRRERFGEIRARMESLNKDLEARLKNVLLPHQFERLKQIDVQARIQQRGASALTSGELADAINLTDEQRQRLEQRAEEVQQELQQKIAELRQEARNKMLDVLTPEQRAKLDELMGSEFNLPDTDDRFRTRGRTGSDRNTRSR